MRSYPFYLTAAVMLLATGCNRPSVSKSESARGAVTIEHPKQPQVRLSQSGRECFYVRDVTPGNRCALMAPPTACASLLEARYAQAVSGGADVQELRKQEKILGDFYLSNGPVQSAVDHYQEALRRDSALKAPEAELDGRALAIAQVRMGEVANCLVNHNNETCVIPISPKARHGDERGSRGAMATLKTMLAKNPDDAMLRWLLNLAAMTVGEYPAGVPKAYRIPAAAFQSREKFPRFTNIATDLGLNQQDMVGGVVLDDFNGDGRLDVVLSSIGDCDPLRLLINNGQGGFDDRTAGSGLELQLSASHMVQADYDNDGRLDLYVTRGIWEKAGEKEVPVYNSLLRNVGEGRFEDVTEKTGLRVGPNSNIASAWADFNNDGWIDLLVCNSFETPRLFLNDKGVKFQAPKQASGLENDGNCMGVATGDVDDDGRVDVFLSVHDGKSVLYLNKGSGTFQPSPTFGAGVPRNAFATWFSDFDNDGRLDLFVGAWDASARDVVGRLMTQKEPGVEHMTVFRNLGQGLFEPVDAGLEEAILVMGANFGDYDNDGFDDLLLGTGGPPFEFLLPNRAYRNKSGKGFADVTYAGGFGNLQKGHGIGFADLDNDGDQDIVASFGGWFPADRFAVSVYENPGFGNHWVTLRLQGTNANRSAIGSRIAVQVTEKGRERWIHRVVSSGGSFGSGSLQAEIGLGGATRIEQISVRWAGSGGVTLLKDLAVDHVYQIVEGKPDAERIAHVGVPFKPRATPPQYHPH